MIEERLREILSSEKSPLTDAMRYALLSGGKRIRPQLVLASAETFGMKPKKALDPACAIELVHIYSLIHDDLPCMDDDDMRRGRPTVHRAFPESIAVLAGDALLTQAFYLLSHAPDLSDRQIIHLIQTLTNHAGINGMLGGQAIDMQGKTKSLPIETLEIMDQKKTGDLFSASLVFGAIIGNATGLVENELVKIGHQIGLAYQIRDDLEDTENDSNSLVQIMGQTAARERLDYLVKEIDTHLSFLPSSAHPIKKVLEPIFHR